MKSWLVAVEMPPYLRPITVALPFLAGVEIIAEDYARFEREVVWRFRLAFWLLILDVVLVLILAVHNFLRALAFWWAS